VDGLSGTLSIPNSGVSGGTLGAGTWVVGAKSTLTLNANVTTLPSAVVLQGPGADFTGLSSLSAITTTGELALQDGASLAPSGDLDNAGTIDLAAGTLNLSGNYTQESTGTYAVGVGGITPGSLYGQLNVTKNATLNGALSVSLIDGYTPPPGDSYQILSFGSETGNFSAEFGLYLGGGEGFTPTFSPVSNPIALDLVVNAENAGTQTTVQSSENPSNFGNSIIFTATVTPTVSTSLVPTGQVDFFDGATKIGSGTLVSGSTTLTISTLAGGSHSIVAKYDGDSNFSGSNSTPITQTVNPIASQTGLQSSENPSVYGDPVTFTATVSSSTSGLATPTGQVEFFDGSTLLDTETLSGGTASYTTANLGVGVDQPIEADYLGDANYNPSNVTILQTVNAPPPATLDGEVYNDPTATGP
jgi:hypothetical protein